MAGAHDVFLYSVPSDADSDDVRLRDPTVAGAGGGAITGTASITEADDTLAATAVIALAATASITEAGDALASTAALALVATASPIEADDTLSATGAVALAAALAATEDGDTLAATGALALAAVAAITEDADTLASAGVVAIAASAGITEGDDTLDAAGVVTGAGAGAGRSGVRRLASSRAYSWNADRISAMLLSVRSLMGQVETAAKQPESATPARIEIPEELAEVALSTAAKPQRIDFIPTSVPLAAMNAASLLGELKSIEARLEALERAAIAREDQGVDDEDAALILLGMPRRPTRAASGRVAASADDDDIAMILLAA